MSWYVRSTMLYVTEYQAYLQQAQLLMGSLQDIMKHLQKFIWKEIILIFYIYNEKITYKLSVVWLPC